MSSGILPSFLGALQASLAVLLTISYGVIASRLNIIKASSAKDMSKLCVRLFLPALMITNVGEELHADTAYRYVPVLIWALTYTLASMALGWVLRRAFKFPAWTIPAICFNNTTALPLLLLQSLETAGILSDLRMSPEDTTSAALKRAKSYFLVSAMVGNSLTFAVGPRLLDDEEAPDKEDDGDDKDQDRSAPVQSQDEEHARARTVSGRTQQEEEEYADPRNIDGRTAEEEEEQDTEATSLLPDSLARRADRAQILANRESGKYFDKLPVAVQKGLAWVSAFLNAPLIGAVIGAVLGFAPPLHRVFFNEPENGGFFKAWLTESVSNIGSLFPPLQLLVVGAKLSGSLMKMKKGEAGGSVPLVPMFSIFLIRFILWPIISIGVIFLIASKTSWLSEDPILWFILMLMPSGPPATKLVSLADVSGASEDEKMSIAKFLTLSYAISPVICFAVVGSLKATLAVGS